MSVAKRSAAYRARRKAELETTGKATVSASPPGSRWTSAASPQRSASLADTAIADRLDELLGANSLRLRSGVRRLDYHDLAIAYATRSGSS